MGRYEALISKYNHLTIIETDMLPSFQSGMCFNNQIYINSNRSEAVKLETLAEELAHHKITYGDIRDQSKMLNRKFELKARRLGCEMVITLEGIIDAFHDGVCNLHEMACYFEVTNNYVLNTIEHYKLKHGISTFCGNYLIRFEPLGVFEYKYF
ncbi:hypothetical protein HpBTM60_04830 [Helicobacter pylori]